MSKEELLEQITKIMLANNERLITAFRGELRNEIEASEERIKEELKKEIRLSQQDTIKVLTSLMEVNYDNHEARIKRVEDELHLPPLKQN